jgi:hypothetical protein
MVTRPDDGPGSTAAWYTCFWQFCRVYLDDRFGTDWMLSAENSLSLLAGNLNIPRKIIVCSPQANNQPLVLPHDTSMYMLRIPKLTSTPSRRPTCERFRQRKRCAPPRRASGRTTKPTS